MEVIQVALSTALEGGRSPGQQVRGCDKFGRIGVLMGGSSAEREVSLKSGKAVCESLKRLDIELAAIDINTDDIKENMRLIKSHKIDCAFIALHGRFGEDGGMQRILDCLKIPYTGSGARASELSMDKVASRKLFEACGLSVPRYREIRRQQKYIKKEIIEDFEFPFVVKPVMQGSSVGLTIVDKKEDVDKSIDLAFSFDERVIIEEYIKGREFTAGILDEEALPVIEIIPKKRFFDYEAKYTPGMTDYIVPARLEGEIAKGLRKRALMAHKALGCSGCSRVDMILRGDNIPFVLEINTIPGLTRMSLLPKAANVAGINFAQLCVKLIQLAYEKAKVKATS